MNDIHMICASVLMHLRHLYRALAKGMYKGLPQACCFLEMMFDLRRFNLLSEESEGFAKLLDALLRFDKISMDPAHVKSLVRPGAQSSQRLWFTTSQACIHLSSPRMPSALPFLISSLGRC